MKIAFATLGCKVNQYDTAAMETAVLGRGDAVVPFAPGADVYVINSCTVTDRADAESRRLVRRARRFNPAARVVLTGCFAQASPEKAAALSEADFVIGVNRLPDVLRAVRGEIEAGAGRVFVGNLRRAAEMTTLGAEVFPGQTRAFLKVQEGCDLFCTFCIVPMARGKSRSVPPREVLRQLERLAAKGFKEVVLTGIHLGGYGADLQPRIDIAGLVERIAEASPVRRVRLSSLDPPEVTPRLLRAMADSDVICPHLHVPVQSGADSVLRRMRRLYDGAFLRDVVAALAGTLPGCGLGTDVIAGFPGETEGEFEATVALLDELPFTYFHVFPYSKRSGTTAAKLSGQLPRVEIERRARVLRRLGERKRREFAARGIGAEHEVLIEATRDRETGLLAGYSRTYVRVLVDGPDAWANTERRVLGESRIGARVIGRAVEAGGSEQRAAV